jgi:hypothetical protein
MLALDAYAEPGDAVLVVSGDRYPLFLYYYHRQFPRGDGPVVYLLPRHGTQIAEDTVESELAPLAQEHKRLWLASFERALQDPENLVESWLEAHRAPVLNVPQDYNYLRLYAFEDAAPRIDSAYRPQNLVDRRLGTVLLIGYDLPTSEFRPGDTMNLALYLGPGEEREGVVVDWVAPNGQTVERWTASVPSATQADRVVRSMVPFAIYEYTMPGRYAIEVHRSGNSTDRVRLAAGRVTHSRRLPRLKIAQPSDVSVGDGLVRFLGYRMRPTERVRPGTRVVIDLFWQAQRRLDTEYTVFVHLLGDYNPATGGPVWAQDDGYPLEGGHPTTRWLPGQTVADRHTVHLPEDIPPGIYAVEVGFYDASSGERLSVENSEQDRILIGEIEIGQ